MIAQRMRADRGFTLIELLVVVAIIVLLVSILMPSLGRARYQARLTSCASNLRQIVVAGNSFAADNDGLYPGYVMIKNVPIPQRMRSFEDIAPGLEAYCGGSVDYKTNKVWQCPQAAIFCKANNVTATSFYATHWNSMYALPSGTYGSLGPGGGYISKDHSEALQGPSGTRKFVAQFGNMFNPWGGGTWESKIVAQDICLLNGNAQDQIVSGHMWGGNVTTHIINPFGNKWSQTARFSANYAFTDGSVRVFHFVRPGLAAGANSIVRVFAFSYPVDYETPILPRDFIEPFSL